MAGDEHPQLLAATAYDPTVLYFYRVSEPAVGRYEVVLVGEKMEEVKKLSI